MIENKKASFMGVVFIVGALFVLLLFGVVLGFGSSTINWVMDETVPELKGLGMVGDFNASEAMDIAVDPVNDFIQDITWVSGLVYIFGLLGVFGLAFAFRVSGEKWMIALFFILMFALIVASIFMSNIYEDVFRGTDEFASILKEHVALSWLVLYSPGIFSIIGFLAGVIMFSGDNSGGVV